MDKLPISVESLQQELLDLYQESQKNFSGDLDKRLSEINFKFNLLQAERNLKFFSDVLEDDKKVTP